jgi:hypothetical protein
MSLVNSALAYIELGYSVIPIKPTSKIPAVQSWKQYQNPDTKLTEDQAREIWAKHPDYNIAIIGGKASGGLLVIDVDPTPDGKENPFPGKREIPNCPTAVTGRGGRHYYFKMPPGIIVPNSNTGKELGPGIDIKSEGGYCVAAPSVHESGNVYYWCTDHELNKPCAELPEPPSWIIEAITGVKQHASDTQPRTPIETLLEEGASHPGRNVALTRVVGWWARKELTRANIETLAYDWNRTKLHPPIEDREVDAVIKSILHKAIMKAQELPPTSEGRPPATEEDKKHTLELIEEQIGIRISEPVKIEGDEPIYQFCINNRIVTMDVETLLSPNGFYIAIAKAANVTPLLPGKKPKEGEMSFREITNRIMWVAEHKDPEEEATEKGQMISWLRHYLKEKSSPRKDREITSREETYVNKKGEVFINLDAFHRFVRLCFDLKQHQRTFVQILRGLDIKKFYPTIILDTGEHLQARYYKIPQPLKEKIDSERDNIILPKEESEKNGDL